MARRKKKKLEADHTTVYNQLQSLRSQLCAKTLRLDKIARIKKETPFDSNGVEIMKGDWLKDQRDIPYKVKSVQPGQIDFTDGTSICGTKGWTIDFNYKPEPEVVKDALGNELKVGDIVVIVTRTDAKTFKITSLSTVNSSIYLTVDGGSVVLKRDVIKVATPPLKKGDKVRLDIGTCVYTLGDKVISNPNSDLMYLIHDSGPLYQYPLSRLVRV